MSYEHDIVETTSGKYICKICNMLANNKAYIRSFNCKQILSDFNKKNDVSDNINPSHYKSHPSGIECIQITRHHNFNIGNVIKYVWRAGLKDGNSDVQDLKKAMWYLEDEIKRLDK